MRLLSFFKPYRVKYLIYILGLLLIQGCANIVPPEGGKKDVIPPELLSITPVDSSLNINITKIELRFDKYMEVQELEKNLQISPFLNISPTVISYGKRVEIKIADSLRPNTTYRLSLGNALVDNREANPYKNFVYIFSTGAYFDSLQLKGRVYDAATGATDTSSVLMLYPVEEGDSAILRKKPLYAARVNSSGDFSFQSLPAKAFRIYALQDANNNYIYDMGQEKVGFIGTTVVPSMQPDSLVFPVFKEWVDTTAFADKKDIDTAKANADLKRKGSFANRGAVKMPKTNIGYQVMADTGNTRLRTFELTRPLVIELYKELSKLDTGKVYLSYDNGGIEVEAVQQLKVDNGDIKIYTQWQSDKLYTLRLVKGWSKDTAGAELPPGKYFFRTKQAEDYGTIRIHVDKQYLGDSFVLYVYKGADSIYQKPLKDSIVTMTLLQPGEYGMRIIRDANKNGKWDAGALFQKLQPEKVIPYSGTIMLKPGWESEIDFLPPAPPKKAAAEIPAAEPVHIHEEGTDAKPPEESKK